MERYFTHDFAEPIGRLTVFATDDAITRVCFGDVPTQCEPGDDRFGFVGQMSEYLEGKRTSFSLPMSYKGASSAASGFSGRVMENMARIPYGQTMSYSSLAAVSGNPKAARAVGMVCNRNPLAILIPCHRVTGRDGSLTGYAGGLAIKRFLLELERNRSAVGTE